MADRAFAVDDEDRPPLSASLLVVYAVHDPDPALGVEIGQKRKRDPAKAVGPGRVGRCAVDAYFKDLDAQSDVVRVALAKCGDLFSSTPGEAGRVKREDDGLAPQFAKRYRVAVVLRQCEIRCGRAGRQCHLVVLL
jgi:hypothetical protein